MERPGVKAGLVMRSPKNTSGSSSQEKDGSRKHDSRQHRNSCLWVKIHKKSDSNQNNTVPATNKCHKPVSRLSARSKAKAKPQPRVLVGTTATIPIHERRWIDIEPSEQNLASYDLSKKVINLLRHNQTLQREEDGAIEFYKIKFSSSKSSSTSTSIGLMNVGKLVWLQEEDTKRRCQYCSDDSGRILFLRALQGHSGSNLINLMLQDNIVIGSGIFHYIYHVGCAFNLYSIVSNGLVLGGQNLSRRTDSSILLAH